MRRPPRIARRGRRRRRSRTLVWAVAAGLALGRAPFSSGADAVEDRYLEILRAWAHGSRSAVEELSDLQQRVVSAGAGFEVSHDTLGKYYGGKYHRMTLGSMSSAEVGRRLPSRGCLGKIQNHVDLQLAALDPEALLPLASFHRLLYVRQMTVEPTRPWLAELSRERSLWLGELYGDKARPRTAAWRLAASTFAAMADVAAGLGLQEPEARARDLYAWVLVYDPANAAGLYWSAYLAERTGDYAAAAGHLEDYLERHGDDPEAALRLGVNRARTGRRKEAAGILESIARGGGPEPWRIVAYQELARLPGEDGRAAAYLREAVAAFPGSSRLRLQLSHLVRADWDESVALVRAVEEGFGGDAGRSPRALYDAPRRRDIDDELGRLQIEVERRRESLAHALDELLAVPAVQRLRLRECAEVRR